MTMILSPNPSMKFCVNWIKSACIFFCAWVAFSQSTQACQITQSTVGNEYRISEECDLLPYNSTHAVNQEAKLFYVQFRYASSFHAYLNGKREIQKYFSYPVASQSFQYGYRMLVGPVDLEHAYTILNELKRRGYRDSLIKFYSEPALPTEVVIPPLLTLDADQLDSEAPSTEPKPTVLKMPTMKSVFSLAGYTAKLPVYDDDFDGRVTRYNQLNLGSFTFRQAQAICQAADSEIATLSEYQLMLKNMKFTMAYAVKSQFWLNEHQTVTRIQDKVITREQNANSHFNVICINR